MNLANLNSLSTQRVKARFGLHPPLLAELLVVVWPELERRRPARLERRADRKRRLVAHAGRPRTVTPLPQVLMTLSYLRHNVQHEVVGALFGFSADTAENAFPAVVPVLRDLFPAENWDAEKQWRRGEPTWTPEAGDQVILDSFESPVRRPSLPKQPKQVYAGKKNRHPLKTQLATDQDGEIRTLEAGQRGPHADRKLYQAAPLPEPIAPKPRMGDKGSHSQEPPESTTPHTKPRGGELTAEQRAENKAIARQRSVVEHAMRRITGFRILRDDYRLALGRFPMIASAVVGLLQLSRIAG